MLTLDLAVAATAWLGARRYPQPQTQVWPTLTARWPLWLAAGGFGRLYGLRHGGALSPMGVRPTSRQHGDGPHWR
ncbi:MAG: hypothetical protein EXR77_03500 [Myxococcales bacterium]|nr:hypothetical protein [Myxococcales bacterium]